MDWFLILLEPLSVIPASTRMVMSHSMFNNASSLLCCLAVFNLCILQHNNLICDWLCGLLWLGGIFFEVGFTWRVRATVYLFIVTRSFFNNPPLNWNFIFLGYLNIYLYLLYIGSKIGTQFRIERSHKNGPFRDPFPSNVPNIYLYLLYIGSKIGTHFRIERSHYRKWTF